MSKKDPKAPGGYGRPPVEHRFQKGQSGNPRGRRPKAKPVALDPAAEPSKSAVLKAAYRPVTVRRGNTVEEIPAIDAMLEAVQQRGLGGSRLHAKLFLDEVRAREADARRQRIEEYGLWRKIATDNQRLLDEAEAEGRPPPAVYPHPVDMTFGAPHEEVKIDGPISAAMIELYLPKIERIRHHVRIAAYNHRHYYPKRTLPRRGSRARKEMEAEDERNPLLPAPIHLAIFANRSLPKSLRMSGSELHGFFVAQLDLPDDELEQAILDYANRGIHLFDGIEPTTEVPRLPWIRQHDWDKALLSDMRDEVVREMRDELPKSLREMAAPLFRQLLK